MTTIRWQPDRAKRLPAWPVPPLFTAMARGFGGHCPACGTTHLFNGFLKVVPVCQNCGAPLGLARADDAPPYFVILVTGHIVIPLLLLAEKFANPPDWELAVTFLPLTLALALALLRPIKGAIVGVIVAFDMLKSEPKFE
jgi:uncharacterized protein (DUF983 family)